MNGTGTLFWTSSENDFEVKNDKSGSVSTDMDSVCVCACACVQEREEEDDEGGGTHTYIDVHVAWGRSEGWKEEGLLMAPQKQAVHQAICTPGC